MSAVEKVKEVVSSLPEDSSYDEIIKELMLNKMIKQGLEDSKQGKVTTNRKMLDKIKSW